jgi:hypothetical protein
MAARPLTLPQSADYEFFIPIRPLSKKNALIPTANGKRIPEDLRALLDSMQLMIQGRWNRRTPLTSVSCHMCFHVSDLRSDLSNAYQTVEDVLKKAGVIVNDSMAHLTHQSSSFIRVSKGQEGVTIYLTGIHQESRYGMV